MLETNTNGGNMLNKTKMWTVTSPNGQILTAVLEENGDVSMSSKKGNHGQVSLDVWTDKLNQMRNAGYTVKEEAI